MSVGALLAIILLGLFILLKASHQTGFAVQSVDYYSFGSAGEQYDRAGSNLAAVSGSGCTLLSPAGEILCSQSLSFAAPAAVGGSALSLFYDAGGSDCMVVRNDGNTLLFSQAEPLLFCDVSDLGYFALATGNGDSGRVQVYDNYTKPVFAFHCAAGNYPAGVRLLGSSRVAVHCLTSAGSTVRVFSLSSGKEEWSFTYEKGILLDMHYFDNGSLALVAEEEILVLGRNGQLQNRFGYNGLLLADYCFAGDRLYLLLNVNRFGKEGTVYRLDDTGECRDRLEVSRSIKSLSAYGPDLLVLYSDELTLYRHDFEDSISYQHSDSAVRALLYENSAVFLVDSYGATRIEFP